MKIRNITLAFKDQLPFKRLLRNLFKGHLFGLISKRSHLRENGDMKVRYNTKESAKRAAENMKKKNNKHFSVYKCLWCDGYHLGKNRENK